MEDNGRLAALTRSGLVAAGFSVDAFGTGCDAEEALSGLSYDAVVLDLGLPDMSGVELLRRLRAAGSSLPVLILTARDSLRDRVDGLDNGADDYLLKPFAMEELVARLRAVMRRPGNALSVRLACGALAFDTVSRRAIVCGLELALSRREGEVLEYLMRKAGRVVRKQAIEASLYGFESDGSSNSVEVVVSRLRRKLSGAAGSPTIHTIRGVGYMLSGPPG